ncbi:MAG: hypothetical protein M3Q71_15485 [Chloroflexota bacterium]|nr:hypothetical protein [Chloroflexota bacterium]MDP9472043.1 hypothetical protein [Chloroflexota bacterium]
MDRHRFDELAKALAGNRSRRDVLRALLGGGAVAFALGAVARVAADEEDEKDAEYCLEKRAELEAKQAKSDAEFAELEEACDVARAGSGETCQPDVINREGSCCDGNACLEQKVGESVCVACHCSTLGTPCTSSDFNGTCDRCFCDVGF